MSFRSDRRSSGDGRPFSGGRSSGAGRPGGASRSSAGGRPFRGRSDRDRRVDRDGGADRDGRSPRGDRFDRGNRFDQGERPQREGRFNRDGRFNQEARSERSSDVGGRSRFDRFDRKAAPGRPGRVERNGRFDRKDRFEGKERFDRRDRGPADRGPVERGPGERSSSDRFSNDRPSRDRFSGDRGPRDRYPSHRSERSNQRFSSRPERGSSSSSDRFRGRQGFRSGSRRGGWARDTSPDQFDQAQRQGEELAHSPDAQADDMLWGRHATQAALEAGRPIHRIWCTAELRSSPKFLQLLRDAKASGVLVEEVTWARLGQLSGGAVHQGIALQTASAETLDLHTLVEGCAALGEPPLLLALDGLTDPHNLGAIVRSAEALGAHGVVLPQRRSAGLTGSVAKVAAGALEHLPVARVVNLNRSLESLKDAGYRVVGLAEEGDVTLPEADLEGPLVVVTGSEGNGLSLLTRRHCDQLIRIPLRGITPSLNASVATAMCLYEVARRGWMKDLKGQAPSPPIIRPRCAGLDSDPIASLKTDEAAGADEALETAAGSETVGVSESALEPEAIAAAEASPQPPHEDAPVASPEVALNPDDIAPALEAGSQHPSEVELELERDQQSAPQVDAVPFQDSVEL